MTFSHGFHHPRISRRTAIQAGAVGLLGLGMNHLRELRPAAGGRAPAGRARACIYIFLSGGLAQHESFDLKPDAPAEVRGEFKPIATATPGIQISEHLPGLARRSRCWAVVRSLTQATNDHTRGHFNMLTGRSVAPAGFLGDRQPRSTDWPAIASIVGDALPAQQPSSGDRAARAARPLDRGSHSGGLRRHDGPQTRSRLHRSVAVWQSLLAQRIPRIHLPQRGEEAPSNTRSAGLSSTEHHPGAGPDLRPVERSAPGCCKTWTGSARRWSEPWKPTASIVSRPCPC